MQLTIEKNTVATDNTVYTVAGDNTVHTVADDNKVYTMPPRVNLFQCQIILRPLLGGQREINLTVHSQAIVNYELESGSKYVGRDL